MIVEPCLPLKGSNTSQRGREMREEEKRHGRGSDRRGGKWKGRKGRVFMCVAEKDVRTYIQDECNKFTDRIKYHFT